MTRDLTKAIRQAIDVDILDDAEIADELGCREEQVRCVREQVNQVELPLPTSLSDEERRARTRRALEAGVRRQTRRRS